MLRILANDGMSNNAAEELRKDSHEVVLEHFTDEKLVEELKISDCVVIRSKTKIRKVLIDKVKNSKLKLIIRAGVGIDNIDHEYAEKCGIKVRNTPNSSSLSVAELVLTHLFSLARNTYISNVTMREGKWLKKEYTGVELNGSTLGLIGYGRIARETARLAKSIGMNVIFYNRSVPKQDPNNILKVSFDELLAKSDFISLHIPYDKERGYLLAREEFQKMKDGAFLVQCARGGLVNENDLVDALESGKLRGAALDVFEEEPCQNKRVLNCDKISLSPHIGASTREAQERIGKETIETIKRELL